MVQKKRKLNLFRRSGKKRKSLFNRKPGKPKLRVRKGRLPYRQEYDDKGLNWAVETFNDHVGPARIFLNRHTLCFETVRYPKGADRWWDPEYSDGIDNREIYRKTTAGGDVRVSREELELMAESVRPYYRL